MTDIKLPKNRKIEFIKEYGFVGLMFITAWLYLFYAVYQFVSVSNAQETIGEEKYFHEKMFDIDGKYRGTEIDMYEHQDLIDSDGSHIGAEINTDKVISEEVIGNLKDSISSLRTHIHSFRSSYESLYNEILAIREKKELSDEDYANDLRLRTEFNDLINQDEKLRAKLDTLQTMLNGAIPEDK